MDRVPFDMYVRGFEESRERAHEAMSNKEMEAAFKPVFEALNWAVAIDDRLRHAWDKSEDKLGDYWSEHYQYGDVVRGVRFARNRVHHSWADALHLSRSGLGREVESNPDFFTWRWRLASDLPGGRRAGERDGTQAAYEKHLETGRVVHTLQELSTCFDVAAADLKPE